MGFVWRWCKYQIFQKSTSRTQCSLSFSDWIVYVRPIRMGIEFRKVHSRQFREQVSKVIQSNKDRFESFSMYVDHLHTLKILKGWSLYYIVIISVHLKFWWTESCWSRTFSNWSCKGFVWTLWIGCYNLWPWKHAFRWDWYLVKWRNGH